MSDRIILRAISEMDTDAIYSYRSLPQVAKYQYWEPYTKSEVEEFVKEYLNQELNKVNEWTGLAIITKDEGVLIGDCALKVEKTKIEIGCNISPAYQRKGLGKETINILLEYAFNHLSVDEVLGITDSRNENSVRLLKSVGMVKDEGFENRIICKNEECIEHKYVINRDRYNFSKIG